MRKADGNASPTKTLKTNKNGITTKPTIHSHRTKILKKKETSFSTIQIAFRPRQSQNQSNSTNIKLSSQRPRQRQKQQPTNFHKPENFTTALEKKKKGTQRRKPSRSATKQYNNPHRRANYILRRARARPTM